MTRVGILAAALALAGCGPLLIRPELETAVGKVMVVWVGEPHDVAHTCATEFGLPGSVACVSMSQGPEQAAAMLERWAEALRARGSGIDCIIATPASLETLAHEMTLCGKQPAWYWNKTVAPGG